MHDFLNKLAKDSGCSLKDMQELWEKAQVQASKKKLKKGMPNHTQHSLQVVKLLASKVKEAKLAPKVEPKKPEVKAEKKKDE